MKLGVTTTATSSRSTGDRNFVGLLLLTSSSTVMAGATVVAALATVTAEGTVVATGRALGPPLVSRVASPLRGERPQATVMATATAKAKVAGGEDYVMDGGSDVTSCSWLTDITIGSDGGREHGGGSGGSGGSGGGSDRGGNFSLGVDGELTVEGPGRVVPDAASDCGERSDHVDRSIGEGSGCRGGDGFDTVSVVGDEPGCQAVEAKVAYTQLLALSMLSTKVATAGGLEAAVASAAVPTLTAVTSVV